MVTSETQYIDRVDWWNLPESLRTEYAASLRQDLGLETRQVVGVYVKGQRVVGAVKHVRDEDGELVVHGNEVVTELVGSQMVTTPDLFVAWQTDTDSCSEMLGIYDSEEKAKEACSAWGDAISGPFSLNETFGREPTYGPAAYFPDFEWLSADEVAAMEVESHGHDS